MSKSSDRRAHVNPPVDPVADIKKVGRRSRSAFLTDLAQRESKVGRQREALRETAGAWKSEDHPDLAEGADAWIREIRSLDSCRFEEIERRRGLK